MKLKTKNRLSLALAGVLPFMPLLRSVLPVVQAEGPANGALILRWVIGAVICGYDAISSASSVGHLAAIGTAIGTPYSGTITYSGGHAGAVVSMSVGGTCLGSYTLAPGLTVTDNGVNTASVTGTPTGGLGTVPFTVTVYEGRFSYYRGLTDTRSTTSDHSEFPAAARFLLRWSSPRKAPVAQVGSDVAILSGGASGNPPPGYYWIRGAIPSADFPPKHIDDSGITVDE